MRMRDFFLLSLQVSSSTVYLKGRRLVYNYLKTNPHELGVVKVRCLAAWAAVTAVHPRPSCVDWAEDVSADGCCCLSGDLQELG